MDREPSITIEVVFALPASLFSKSLRLPANSTVAQAIAASGFANEFPQVSITEDNVGVFSRKSGLDHVLADGDRVEIYRPLRVTPNEARKLRAARKGDVSTHHRPRRHSSGET